MKENKYISNEKLCQVNSSDTLLELHRKFTDKEKFSWIIKEHNSLKNKYQDLVLENKNLKIKNQKLKKQIDDDGLQYPSQFNGKYHVSVKAYSKLQERYGQLNDRFWEVMQELNKIKNADCELL